MPRDRVRVLGNDEPQASMPAEIIVHHKDGFYPYDAKYVTADGADPRLADIPPSDRARAQLGQDTFPLSGTAGMARVDFFLDRRAARST